MRNIPFSPPDITQTEIDAVVEVLKSGWITTGPKTKAFEKGIANQSFARLCQVAIIIVLDIALPEYLHTVS